jgi:glycosyltransferase involved in cell wall biosynthesis
MRVALIAPPWITVPPPGYGGTEAVIDTLARGLRSAGHDVLLVTTADSTCPVERTWVYDQARTELMGDVTVELRHLLHAYEATDGADIIHDHTIAGPVYAAARSQRNVITTNHNPFTDDAKAIYRSIAHRVPIVAISRHHALTAGDLPIARVICHGVDENRYPVGDGGGDYLVFLGRMSPAKGVHEAIEIALQAGMPLRIAAKMRSRDERLYFDNVVAPLLGDDICYVGEVGGDDKVELLGGARALLNPIRWQEPFGLCMIEALACGTPVITAPRGAAPEIVDHGVTGFLCRGTADMVAAVEWAGRLDRAACRAAVVERFTAARMVADHIALYNDVLNGGTDRRSPDHTPAPHERQVLPPAAS